MTGISRTTTIIREERGIGPVGASRLNTPTMSVAAIDMAANSCRSVVEAIWAGGGTTLAVETGVGCRGWSSASVTSTHSTAIELIKTPMASD